MQRDSIAQYGFWGLEDLKISIFILGICSKCILYSLLCPRLILNVDAAQIGESMCPNSHQYIEFQVPMHLSVLCFGHYMKKLC
jgi:hypothetical protein